MREIRYKLGRYIFAHQTESKAMLIDTNDNDIAIVFDIDNMAVGERLVVSLRVYGTETVFKIELDSIICKLPKSLVKESKIIGNVEKFNSNGKMITSWVLEPIRLVSIANQETYTLQAIPDIADIRDLMLKQLEIYDSSINKLLLEQVTLQTTINELNTRIKGCEEIILNPFSK